MLNIYLARHGQDEDNANGILNGHRDKPLTKKGVEQAETTAVTIKDCGLKFDKIYTSPLIRAKKTAEIIAKKTNSPKPIIVNLLIERDFGILTGKTHSDIPKLCTKTLFASVTGFHYMLSAPKLETFPKTIIRAKKILTKLKNKHKKGNILLVTHGDFGKMIYAAYYRLKWKEVLVQFHFGNSDLLLLSPKTKPQDSQVFKVRQHNL